MSWFVEDVLGFLELPSLDSGLRLNLHLGLVELLVPFVQDVYALVDYSDRICWFHLENATNIYLVPDLFTDFIRDAFKEVFHLGFLVVDMS